MSVHAQPRSVALTIKEAVAYIEVQRASRHNAIDVDTANALVDRCRELDSNDLVRAVVLFGQGASFGVGGDLSELKFDPPRTARRIIGPLHETISILVGLDAPVIAKVRGNVAGSSANQRGHVAAIQSTLNFRSDEFRANAELSFPKTHRVRLDPVMRPIVHSGNATRQPLGTRGPYLGQALARLGLGQSISRDRCVRQRW
jgi:Enoyl-CoA hydratase/isomerase